MKTTTTIRLLLIIIAAGITFTACKKLKYYEFDDDDKAWINVYSKGETFRFVSDSGDVRAYSVTSSTRGYSEEGKNYYSVAEATVRPEDTLQYQYPGGIRALKNATGFTLEILWCHHPAITEIASKAPATLTLGGITYSDVYVSEVPAAVTDSVTNVQKVYYSKSAGFVQYIENTGLTWTRQN